MTMVDKKHTTQYNETYEVNTYDKFCTIKKV